MTPYQPPPPAPVRLHVLMAREAPVAVILRRGPTGWVQMIKWHTDTDVFESGQWFHGRIYTEQCDLSPDGQLLVYFASKYSKQRLLDNKFAWTAISKPPYFTALDIQFQGGTRGGGGIFSNAGQVWFYYRNDLNWSPKELAIVSTNNSLPDQSHPAFPYTYPERMRRHFGGWHEVGHVGTSKWPRLIWQKSVGAYTLTYTELSYSQEPRDVVSYVLKQNEDEIALTGILQADFDQQGRLILAKEGKLFAGVPENSELKLTELVDFNANKPESVVAPDWAQKW